MEKLYALFTDASHYAYSGVLTQTVECPEDLRPIAYTSSSFSEMQQRWSATKKEAYAVYQSVLKFNLYLRWAKCVLHYNHKPLETFLSKGIKISKFNMWSMILAHYNITCATNMHTVSTSTLHTEQKWDKTCRKLA